MVSATDVRFWISVRNLSEKKVSAQPIDQLTTRPIDQFIDRRLLEQIHRLTLTLLRKEVQPVSLDAYADFLARWQHLHDKLSGEDGLRHVLEQLRGVALPANVWERDALPARLADFDAVLSEVEGLDALCQSGELVWVAQRNRVRFFFRGEGALFLDKPDESALSADARKIYEYLKSEGASFTADIVGAFNKTPLPALAELVMAGLVTNDSLDALHMAAGTHSKGEQPFVSTETELAARLAQTPRSLTRSRYRDAKRRVAKRLRAPVGATHVSPLPQGRWSLVHRARVLGEPLSDDARADKLARVLLARYGVVTRECLEREDIASDWAMVYSTLQRMEMRGEVRRGYFVEGLSGAQFALPDAVEKLRAPADDTLIVLNATDPANIANVARLPSTDVVIWQGKAVLIAEDNGERITMPQDVAREVIERALQAYLERPNAPRHITIAQWNGVGVLDSDACTLLQALGFHRTPKGMER